MVSLQSVQTISDFSLRLKNNYDKFVFVLNKKVLLKNIFLFLFEDPDARLLCWQRPYAGVFKADMAKQHLSNKEMLLLKKSEHAAEMTE